MSPMRRITVARNYAGCPEPIQHQQPPHERYLYDIVPLHHSLSKKKVGKFSAFPAQLAYRVLFLPQYGP